MSRPSSLFGHLARNRAILLRILYLTIGGTDAF